MSETLQGMVYDQVEAEGPQIENEAERIAYVIEEINAMNNYELLERISKALKKARAEDMGRWV
jgi:hypothetical protein